MSTARAHAASLPLYATLTRLDDSPAPDVSQELREVLDKLSLSDDLDVVLLVKDEGVGIDFEAKTDFGNDILKELDARSHFPPCPDGECELNPQGVCKWCGTVKH